MAFGMTKTLNLGRYGTGFLTSCDSYHRSRITGRIGDQSSGSCRAASELLLKPSSTLIAQGLTNLQVLARNLARWLVWRSGAYNPHWPKATGMWPVACGPHRPPLSLMLRRWSSPGSDARHRSPDVILDEAEYALFFAIYICLSFSLSLFFRQSLLYDS